MADIVRWTVQGDLVMDAAAEAQYALTAADTLGPLPPGPVRAGWVGTGAVSGDLPWLNLGTFTADGPVQGHIAVELAADAGGRRNWGYGSGNAGLLLLFLVDLAASSGVAPAHGRWPFSGSTPGVVIPVNYPAPAPFAVLQFVAQANGTPGRYRCVPCTDIGYYPTYWLGYSNDAVNGYGGIAPTPPWSTADGDGTTAGGGVQVVANFPQDALWPLVAGHRYAVMACPFAGGVLSQRQSWADAWPSGGGARGAAQVGTGYEDYPSFGTGPGDHWTVPDVHGTYPFGWPQYDPPEVPAGYALTQGHIGTSVVPPFAGAPTEHFRTGQRLHLEAYSVKVSAVGPALPPGSVPPAAKGSSDWWWLLLAGAAAGVAVAVERQRTHHR